MIPQKILMSIVNISWKAVEIFLLISAAVWWTAFYLYNSVLAKGRTKTGAIEY